MCIHMYLCIAYIFSNTLFHAFCACILCIYNSTKEPTLAAKHYVQAVFSSRIQPVLVK